jgi:stringent starvation protein B
MSVNSPKQNIICSIYDWCISNDFTPFISVKNYPGLNMPKKYIKNDEIIFNISMEAVLDLFINNDFICFIARFNGISRKLEIPMSAVKGIFAKEVNQGIVFSSEKNDKNQDIINNEQNNTVPDSVTYPQKNKTKPNLRIVK